MQNQITNAVLTLGGSPPDLLVAELIQTMFHPLYRIFKVLVTILQEQFLYPS